MANERLRALEEVEKEIAMVLQCAGEDNLNSATNYSVALIQGKYIFLPLKAFTNENNC